MDHDPTDIALQDSLREEASRKARALSQTEIGDLKWVLGNKRGRRFVHALLEAAGVFRLSFVNDPHATAFNEGQRNLGLRTLDQVLAHAPESYPLMLSEHHDRSNVDR